MVKSFVCPNGHEWRDADDCNECPVCGSKAADTVGNGSARHESTENGVTDSERKTSDESTGSRYGRYQVISELGRGGMGVVYRAFDPLHEREVALKTLTNSDPALLSRFKREFRVMAEIDHPNVAKLFELNSDGETWFFTMEIIEGVDLVSYLEQSDSKQKETSPLECLEETDLTLVLERSPSKFSEERSRRLGNTFSQLAQAVIALHSNGIVHRDIKPSNVMVTRDERVVLLDFGLVAETDPSGVHLSLHQQLMGTVAYMSPEQAACDPVSAASDWYSVGVMLYQTLTERLPFAGKAVDILVNKQKFDPIPPSEISHAVNSEWNNLCLKLLRRDQENRANAEDVLTMLGGSTDGRNVSEVSRPVETILVGREQQLKVLRNSWDQVRRGIPKCALIEGISGTGKSVLVEAFLAEADQGDVVVLRGRCYEMESVPFKAIDSLIDSLVAHLRRLSTADAAALMPRDIHALARLFPVLQQVKAVAKIPIRNVEVSDQKDTNRRAIAALRELLARMGDRYPMVVYIDDLQWGDEDSAAMLSDLLQPPDAPLILFLGTYRSEDAQKSQFLQAFRQIQREREVPVELLEVEVTPLEFSDSVNLALSLLKRNDENAVRNAKLIAREAGGNPFFVSELVTHLQLEGEHATDASEPSSLVDMIWSRVQRLPEESQQLLAVVALWGQPLPLDHAMHIADVGQSAVGPLRKGHFIRTVGLADDSTIETYHDRIRESVSARLNQSNRRQLQLCIADHCVQQLNLDDKEILVRLGEYFTKGSAFPDDQLEVAPTWYDIAFHFDAAERPDLAFPYALATAEKARTQVSLEVAEQQYRIAERGVDIHANTFKYRVAEGLGDVLMVRGDYDQARLRFDRALELNPDSRTRIEAKLGELAFRQGDMEKAIEISERVLTQLGQRVPRRSLLIYFHVAREAFVQVLHSMFPGWFVARRKLGDVDKPRLVIRLHNRLTYAYYFEHRELCLWNHLRGMNLAERYPPTLELALAYAIQAPVMGLIGFFSRGVTYAQKSLAMYKSLGDLWGQGLAVSYHGLVLYAASDYEECIAKCREAVTLLERAGDLWEVNVARVHVAFCLFKMGDLAASAEVAKRVHFSGVELGDSKASGFSLDVWAWSTGGQVPPEILQIELQRPREDVQASAQVLMAEGVRLFNLSRFEEAAAVFEKGHQLAEDSSVRSTYVLPHLPWLASALRRQAEKLTKTEPARLNALLKRANRAATKSVRIARKFQNDLPHALREAGLMGAIRGSDRRARKYFDESLEVAKRQGARFEHAQSLLARGRTGQKLHWQGADDDVEAAKQELISLGAEFALEYIPAPSQSEMV